MVGLVLQRACWRRALPLLPCLRANLQRSIVSKHDEINIETLTAKWQPHWDSLAPQWNELRPNDKGKAYVLPMFPYPSGTLHLGHLRVYTISDVLARFKHMQGYNVLHPIGWDAFGLPAENAAIERGVHPEKWTLQNIEAMKAQMKQMGGRWDWDSEIRTCDPDFYKHTQRLFLMLHQRGLAYQAESLVNYDPVDKTVLANEQVDSNGCSWRSGAKVEKVMLKQWFLKIREYQKPLLQDLRKLEERGTWPEKVIAMQRNWIGRPDSRAVRIWFDIEHKTGETNLPSIDILTTRLDTIFGAQYIALSLDHPIVQQLFSGDASLRAFIERARSLPSDTKEGYLLPQLVARNPIAEQIEGVEPTIPVYVTPYVLGHYGTGAVMGVPGHDVRDHAFWRANLGDAPIKVVVTTEPGIIPPPLVPGIDDKPMTELGYIAANIDRYEGLPSKDAWKDIMGELSALKFHPHAGLKWRLRDWLISRQRYWGTPIPIIHCEACGPVPVPESDLPVKLPDLPDSFFDGRKGNPLADDEAWKKTECPKCGSAAERETDTMDTFMDSSWYFFRFLDPKNETTLVDPQRADEGMPVDLYVGGVEHAILHLLYARFISKFLASTSVWPGGSLVHGEPFKQLITQGMVHGETFTDPENGRVLRPDELDLTDRSKPMIKATGLAPMRSYEKMSKSKHNGVDPGVMIAKYGADATRAHMLFQAPIGDVLEWDEMKITGIQRWLRKIIRLSSEFSNSDGDHGRLEPLGPPDTLLLPLLRMLSVKGIWPATSTGDALTSDSSDLLLSLLHGQEKKLWVQTQQTIASVTESYSKTYSLNTIVSDLMTLTNMIVEMPHCSAATPYLKWYSTAHLVRMMAPIAPGAAEEAWHMLNAVSPSAKLSGAAEGQDTTVTTVFAAGFPTADMDVVPRLSDHVKCVVQINGKRKFEVEIEKVKVSDSQVNYESAPWLLGALRETEAGKAWLDPDCGKIWGLSSTKVPHPVLKFIPEDWEAIVVNNGKLCNLVGPKGGKKQARPPKPQTLPPQTDTDAIHARLRTLMALLPEALQPRYVPPSLCPLNKMAIKHALENSRRLQPGSKAYRAHVLHYMQHLSKLPDIPRTIPHDHVLQVDQVDKAKFDGRRKTLLKHNPFFIEQLSLMCRPSPPFNFLSQDQRVTILNHFSGPDSPVRNQWNGLIGYPDEVRRQFEKVTAIWRDIVGLWAIDAKVPEYVDLGGDNDGESDESKIVGGPVAGKAADTEVLAEETKEARRMDSVPTRRTYIK